MLVKIPVKRDSDVFVQGGGTLSGKWFNNPPYVEFNGKRVYGIFYGHDEYASGWAIDILGKRYALHLEKGSFLFPHVPKEGEHIVIDARRLNRITGLIKETIELQSDPEFGNPFVRFP
jgi:hypothetical protein